MDRTAFIERFCIVILVQVVNKMGRRLSPNPQIEAGRVYEAFRLARGQASLSREAFIEAVAPELAGLFCDWQRGKRVDHHAMAGAVFDGLQRAGASITLAPQRQDGPTSIRRSA
ncbi:MAG: hypothetical protein JO055_18615 [Alphaproteobacteria bacterium]|nr:hypothetical protein [Alphaproteobacteria bacterium]